MSIYKPGRPNKFDPSSCTGKRPPAKPGEYRIRDCTGIIIYIGEACNLKRRMNEHIRTGKLQTGKNGCTFEYKIADGRSTSRTRRAHERLKIKQHNPGMNQSKGGEGRIAKRRAS